MSTSPTSKETESDSIFEESPFSQGSLRNVDGIDMSPFYGMQKTTTQINELYTHTHSLEASVPLAPPNKVNWVALGKSLPPLHPVKQSKKVMVNSLYITDQQRLQIKEKYDCGAFFERTYTESEQLEASAKLSELGLSQDSRRNLESRWTTRTSKRWANNERTLFQCGCGYDSKSRQRKEENQGIKRSSEEWERRAPYPFTGCLAHIEMIRRVSNGTIAWIAGILEHNDSCSTAFLERCPPIPLHEHVYEIALEQLRNGASITAVQGKNREMIAARLYRGMNTHDPANANIRYLFLPSDHSTLYRKAALRVGVDTRQLLQYNVDDWLNPDSPKYKPEISQAVFHYSAQAEAMDRFEICISTPEMDEAAHKYAHHSQMILDGTFGICSSRLLLFIALAIDEDRKGIPIAFLLFSASSKAKATHASYDTHILIRLLQTWKAHLAQKFGAFDPYSCITDTDTKERGALVAVWKQIILLICKFHLRQCWTNNRKKLFKFNGSEYWRNVISNTLYNLEIQLISSIEHSSTLALVDSVRKYFAGIITNNPEGKRVAEAGLAHLKYLDEYWMRSALWQSWSEWGRLAAAAAIGIPIEGIIPTTNHLESFNAVLKRKYIRQYFHSGHRLRFDLLIFLLVTEILPQVYSRRRAMREHLQWLNTRFFQSAGGQNLSELQEKLAASKKEHNRILMSVCWWKADATRDQHAQDIIRAQKIGTFAYGETRDVLTASCIPSKPGSPPYVLRLCRNGEGLCTCPDFYNYGGACKHLRAFRLIIEDWVHRGLDAPFYFPPSLAVAQEIKQSSGVIDGPQSDPSTPPSIPSQDHILERWSTLQALGNDRVILGRDDDEEDDIEAVVEKSEEEAEEEDQPNVPSFGFYEGQKEAINAQIGHRLTQEIVSLLPKLDGLQILLNDASSLPESDEVTNLQRRLRELSVRMAEFTGAGGPPSISVSEGIQLENHAPENHQHESSKRARLERPALRAPSPEGTQKRKASHGTL